MYRILRSSICSAFAAFFCLAVPAFADVEWTVKKQLNLEAAPVDVATSPDGKWVFVLTQGVVLVYSGADSTVVNRIPVDKGFDRVTFSEKDSLLILTSS